MEDIINNLDQYIAVLTPAIVSILSMIATVIAAVKNIKALNNDTKEETRSIKRTIAATSNQINTVLNDNTNLKSKLNELSDSLICEIKAIKSENSTLRKELTKLEEIATQNASNAVLIEEMKKQLAQISARLEK